MVPIQILDKQKNVKEKREQHLNMFKSSLQDTSGKEYTYAKINL